MLMSWFFRRTSDLKKKIYGMKNDFDIHYTIPPSTVSSYDIISISKRLYVNQILLDKRFLNLLDMDKNFFKFLKKLEKSKHFEPYQSKWDILLTEYKTCYLVTYYFSVFFKLLLPTASYFPIIPKKMNASHKLS